MRALLSVISLFAMALPAFADSTQLPEPGVLGLLGIGAVALLVAHRGRK